jgi:hypothetical protein
MLAALTHSIRMWESGWIAPYARCRSHRGEAQDVLQSRCVVTACVLDMLMRGMHVTALNQLCLLSSCFNLQVGHPHLIRACCEVPAWPRHGPGGGDVHFRAGGCGHVQPHSDSTQAGGRADGAQVPGGGEGRGRGRGMHASTCDAAARVQLHHGLSCWSEGRVHGAALADCACMAA